jgi:YHS domain-containing protein
MTRNLLCFATALLVSFSVYAKDPVFATEDGAIRGYDPVAYFTEGKPVKGDAGISTVWKEATWHFASTENRDAFAADPDKYAPAYGGYCAYAVANGYTATTEPDAWTVVEGRLFLNYSERVKERWKKDIKGYVTKADANWPGVLSN